MSISLLQKTSLKTISYFATIFDIIRKRSSLKIAFLDGSGDEKIIAVFRQGVLTRVEGKNLANPIDNLKTVIQWRKGEYLENRINANEEIENNVKLNVRLLTRKLTRWETSEFTVTPINKNTYNPRVSLRDLESIFFDIKGKPVENYSSEEWINIKLLTVRLENEQFSGNILAKSKDAQGIILFSKGVITAAFYRDKEKHCFNMKAIERIFQVNHEINFEVKMYRMWVHVLAPLLTIMTGNKTVDKISNRVLDVEKLIRSYQEEKITCCVWARGEVETSILLIYMGVIVGSLIISKGEIHPSIEPFLLICYATLASIEVFEYCS